MYILSRYFVIIHQLHSYYTKLCTQNQLYLIYISYQLSPTLNVLFYQLKVWFLICDWLHITRHNEWSSFQQRMWLPTYDKHMHAENSHCGLQLKRSNSSVVDELHVWFNQRFILYLIYEFFKTIIVQTISVYCYINVIY